MTEPTWNNGGPIIEMDAGQKIKSGLFTDAERNAVPPEVQAAFAQAFAEVEMSLDFADEFHRLAVYETIRIKGATYIKKPDGSPEILKVYINQLEKSLLNIHGKFKATNDALIESNLRLLKVESELDKLKTSVAKRNKKKRKGKA